VVDACVYRVQRKKGKRGGHEHSFYVSGIL